jgi:hypothetical protein
MFNRIYVTIPRIRKSKKDEKMKRGKKKKKEKEKKGNTQFEK